MKKVIGIMALGLGMILFSSCGDDNDDTPPIPQTIQGTVVGSHYEGAWVCVDSNSDGLCDGEESITVSDANGKWTLDNPYSNALSVVAEIYVDNIKHTSYPAPPSATPVEKPMIFIAPLQGEVGNQLIVSPISTMVYRSMQSNGIPFEEAKESVAQELGVSSDTLLTYYSVENPSADHIALQQRSDDETEKLGLTMWYHDNIVEFQNDNLQAGKYVVKDFYIPSAQDPDHHVKIGTVATMDVYDNSGARVGDLDFKLGRKSSTAVATWWKNRVSADQNIFGINPDNGLNFAMKGDLTIMISGTNYVFSDFFMGQGSFFKAFNQWWIGSRACKNTSEDRMTCTGKDENGNTFEFKFVESEDDQFTINKE